MLAPFLRTAMTAPGRQLAFRRAVAGHLAAVSLLVLAVVRSDQPAALSIAAQLLLVLGLVEGAALVGWRLAQLPKSQALEFLLVSPVQPKRVFVAEALAGIGRFALVCLGGLPVFGVLLLTGRIEPSDLWVLIGMPLGWGVIAGLGLTAWIYEPARVRRIGELIGLAGVFVYLVVGVLAAENLRRWLEALPEWLGRFLFDAVLLLHTMNPFGVVRYWFERDRVERIAWDRLYDLHFVAGGLLVVIFARAATRLRGHFHDRHYRPIDSTRADQSPLIGDRPLSWWAVRRVMEYSGRVNLWLAVGFAGVYAGYIAAGDSWPPWLGRLVFQLFDGWGGAAAVATALVVLAAVPAAYQFGLWDATVPARCQRLELLLLTELSGRDYCHAAFAAAWARGCGYLVGAMALWLALAVAGKMMWWDVPAAVLGAATVWAFAFAVGYRGFATGHQTNGLASVLTLGLPLLLYLLWRPGLYEVAALLPTAGPFVPARAGVSVWWLLGLLLTAGTAYGLLRTGVRRCETDLRRWYDANQGTKAG